MLNASKHRKIFLAAYFKYFEWAMTCQQTRRRKDLIGIENYENKDTFTGIENTVDKLSTKQGKKKGGG